MTWKIPLFKIYWEEDDVRAVSAVIKSGANWATGEHVDKLETEIAKFVGAPYALAFSSGTAALHAMMLAFGIGKGDEVIVPSFTFIATANAPLFVGATPVFAEIEQKTYGLDPKDVERRITPRTKAIMPIHYGGGVANIKAMQRIAKKHNILLLEDAAESLGAKVGKQYVGTFGQAGMYSFCAPKVITTGEGGVAVTKDKKAYEKMKLLRSHGRAETANYFSTAEYMDYVELGYNFRLSNILAALARTQLKKIKKIAQLRKKNATYFTKQLSGIEEISLPTATKETFHVYQMYTIFVKEGQKTREELRRYLNSKGIMAKVYFAPVHLTKFYKRKGWKKGDLPKTESIANSVLTLPMYPVLKKKEMDTMVREIKKFFSSAL